MCFAHFGLDALGPLHLADVLELGVLHALHVEVGVVVHHVGRAQQVRVLKGVVNGKGKYLHLN